MSNNKRKLLKNCSKRHIRCVTSQLCDIFDYTSDNTIRETIEIPNTQFCPFISNASSLGSTFNIENSKDLVAVYFSNNSIKYSLQDDGRFK